MNINFESKEFKDSHKPMLIIDLKYKVKFINNAGVTLSGLRKNDALGRYPGEIISCVNDISDSKCGNDFSCSFCNVRAVVKEVLYYKKDITNRTIKIQRLIDNHSRDIDINIFSSYTEHNNEPLVLIGIN